MSAKRQPNGIRAGGQFAATGRSEATVAITRPGSPPPVLDHRAERAKIMESYGLTVDEVPGLEVAWDEHFAPLDLPHPKTSEDLASEIVGDYALGRLRAGPTVMPASEAFEEGGWTGPADHGLTDDEPVVFIHTRNGGGNREYYGYVMEALEEHPGYVTDFDESFDSTYADIVLRLTPEQKAEYREIATSGNDDLAARQRVLISEIEQMRRADCAPWSVMAAPEAPRAAQQRVISYHENPDSEARLAQKVEAARSVREVLDGKAGRREGGAVPRDVAQEIVEVQSARAEAEKFERIWEAAQKVEDPELRAWLTEDRPELSYKTAEGRGRSKRTLTRRFIPKSRLLTEVESARTAARSAESYMVYTTKYLDESDKAEAELAEYRRKREEAQRARDELAAMGWPGPGPAPKPLADD